MCTNRYKNAGPRNLRATCGLEVYCTRRRYDTNYFRSVLSAVTAPHTSSISLTITFSMPGLNQQE